MTDKARADDFAGRFREIVSDPLNLAIARVPQAGMVTEGCVILHNGHRVPLRGPGAYYEGFSDILIINRGVHEPLEEYAFQQVLATLPDGGTMMELGAYWAHYSMWFLQGRPGARAVLVEPGDAERAAGEANFARNGHAGRFIAGAVGAGQMTVDGLMADQGLDRLAILHADIQGQEFDMLDGARRALRLRRIDHLFVSTHSQALHRDCLRRLGHHGYRIEASADFEQETTSYDGFILAVNPDLPRVLPDHPLMGRSAILAARPADLAAVVAAFTPP